MFSSALFADETMDKLSRKAILDSVFLSLEESISINSDSVAALTKKYIEECEELQRDIMYWERRILLELLIILLHLIISIGLNVSLNEIRR